MWRWMNINLVQKISKINYFLGSFSKKIQLLCHLQAIICSQSMSRVGFGQVGFFLFFSESDIFHFSQFFPRTNTEQGRISYNPIFGMNRYNLSITMCHKRSMQVLQGKHFTGAGNNQFRSCKVNICTGAGNSQIPPTDQAHQDTAW